MDSPMAGATDKQSLFLELRIHNRGPRCVHKTKKGCMCERVNWLPYQKNVVKGKSSTKQVTQGCSDVEDWWLGVYKQNNPSHWHMHAYTHAHTHAHTHTHAHMQHLKCVFSHFLTQAWPREQWTEVQKERQSREWNCIFAAKMWAAVCF